jgi:siroheme synthase
MNARTPATICALLAALSSLIGCESSRPDPQFQKQVMRAQECRQLQDRLVGDQPLTPERGEEIAKTMNRNGCSAGAAVDATRMQ